MSTSSIDILIVARRIANHAKNAGILSENGSPNIKRPICNHLGAVLADAILQAGLNYTSVVKPRVLKILSEYSDYNTSSSLKLIINNRKTDSFLNWSHPEKINRFEGLVHFLYKNDIEDVNELRVNLASEKFCRDLQCLNGIGPKTVDYMACLVGMDSIAVDRHVRTFAKKVGIENNNYEFLKASFCCAADLLSVPRREFDSWLWRSATISKNAQLEIVF